jgi:hypothetical protein
MLTVTNMLELFDRTIEDKTLMHVDAITGQRSILDKGRNWLNPDDSLSYELYRVADYTGSHPNNGAIGGAGQVQMQVNSLDSTPVLAHELGHEWNGLFNVDSEFLTTYMHNVYRQPAAYINLFADGITSKNDSDVYANASTEQFTNKSELMNYATNLEELIYAIDGLIALKVLNLPLSEQAQYLKRALVNSEMGAIQNDVDTANNIHVKDLSELEIANMKLKTIEDLIDNDLVIMQPGDTKTNILGNRGQGYGTTLTYAAFFLINGKPYHHNHRIINTLISYNGWEAFKTFNIEYNHVYNQIKSQADLSEEEKVGTASISALRTTYGDSTLNYSDIIKKNYIKSMNKLVDNGLLDSSYEDLFSNLNTTRLENFYSYKLNMINKYFGLTNDFSNEAFGTTSDIGQSVTNYSELFQAVSEKPTGTIQLKNDITVEGAFADQKLPPFSGTLKGNGYRITGNTHSLFSELNNAEIANLVIDKTIFENRDENSGALVDIADNANCYDIHVVDSEITTPKETTGIVGGIIGKSSNSKISDSSVQNTTLYGTYVGGVIGRSDNTQLRNVYSTGSIATSAHVSDIRIGGIIGNGFKGTTVRNSYTTMTIEQGNGMLGSDYSYDPNRNITFSNSISLADVLSEKNFKFYSSEVSAMFSHNYELEGLNRQSSVDHFSLAV